MSRYDEIAREMATMQARRALKPPKRLEVIIDPRRAEAEYLELNMAASRPLGTPKRVTIDPSQVRRLFPNGSKT